MQTKQIMSTRKGSNGDDDTSQPDAKRQRKIYLGGPVEDEETAEKKLSDKGFDKGNYTRPQEITITLELADCHDEESVIQKTHTLVSTPMVEFCREGDLNMCRYLLMKGASANQEPYDDGCGQEMFPLLRAVISTRLGVCKLLHQNGADIRRRDKQGFSLIERCPYNGRVDEMNNAWEWLILNGALTDGNGALCADYRIAMRQHSSTEWKSHISSRIDEAQDTRKTFFTFLLGTLHLKHSNEVVPSPVWLCGHPEIFEVIADYLGVVRGRYLRIFLQLDPKLKQQIGETSDIEKPSVIIEEISSHITNVEEMVKFLSITVSELTERSDESDARVQKLQRERDQLTSERRELVSERDQLTSERRELVSSFATLFGQHPEKREQIAVLLNMAPESSVDEVAAALVEVGNNELRSLFAQLKATLQE